MLGKGDKVRSILLSAETWRDLEELRGEAPASEPIFAARGGRPLDASTVWQVGNAAAKAAGVSEAASCHWLRHAHASHSLGRGAPISLVQATLGNASLATTGRYPHARPADNSGRNLAV